MQTDKSVTFEEKSVTQERDSLARARPLFQGDVTLSRVTVQRDVTHVDRDSDMPALGPSRHHHGQTEVHGRRNSPAKPVGTWLHIAAMNLIHDHEAGVAVDPGRLAVARKLVAQLKGVQP